MDSAGKRQKPAPFGSGKPRRRIAFGLMACWALAGSTAWTTAPATVSAAESGPTALFYVRSPKALWDGLASLAPSEEAAGVMRGFLEGATEGLDFERPLGFRIEFSEDQSFYYRAAIPTKDGAAVLERVAPFLPGLRKADADGSRDFAGGVVQARDGYLFFATDADRLKPLRGAASLLPENAPEADILVSFRPRTVPGFLRRSFLDGLEAEFKKELAKADSDEEPALPFGDDAEKPPATPEERWLKRVSSRIAVRYAKAVLQRILLDTEEISLAVRVRKRSLEVEWLQRLPADLPEARRFEERAAPSRFAVWETKEAGSYIRESTVGSRTSWTTAVRDEIAHLLKNPPAAELKLPHAELVPLLTWGEKYLATGARDWGNAIRRGDDRMVLLFGLAHPDLGEIVPALNKLQAEFFARHADKFEFKPAAWKEGDFVVNLIVPIGLDEKLETELHRLYGKKAEFAVALGPDRILVVVGEDCRGLLRTAIEETARPRETREPFRLRMDPVADLRRTLAATDELGILTEAHKARLKALLSQAPDAEADGVEMQVTCDGLTHVGTFRFGHTISRAFALTVGAGIEQGFAKAKAAAERGK